jgi:Family of unknown function (DUF6263)
MYKLTLFLCLAILLTACTSDNKTEGTPKKVLLKLDPEKGKVYPMLYSLNVHNDTTGDETTFTIELLNKIENVSNDAVSISSVYENISMVGNLKGTDVKLMAGDTLKSIPEATLMAAPVFAFHKRKVNFEYTKEFRKTNEIIENADTIKALANVQSKAQFIAQYPKKEVGVNDSWESDIELKFGEKNAKNVLFTVRSISETEIVVDLKGKIDSKGEKFGHEFSMTGDFTGEITIDKKTGWQNKCALHIQFVLSIMGNQTPMKQEITYNLR